MGYRQFVMGQCVRASICGGFAILLLLSSASDTQAHYPLDTIARAVVEAQSGYLYGRDGRLIPNDLLAPAMERDLVAWDLPTAEGSPQFKAIASFTHKGCTGSLVGDVQRPTAPAYILTAAHCLKLDGSIGEKVALQNGLPVQLPFKYREVFRFEQFAKRPKSPVTLEAKQVVYYNYKDHDIALIELQTTVQGARERGLEPFTLARHPVKFGMKIEVVGIPGQDIAEKDRVLRQSTCTVEEIADAMVDIIDSASKKSQRFHRSQSIGFHCSLIGGSSGSPVLSRESGQIIAVASNAGIFSSQRPREVQALQSLAVPTNLGSGTQGLESCFNPQSGAFDLTIENCRMQRPGSDTVSQCAAGVGAACWDIAEKILAAPGFDKAESPLPPERLQAALDILEKGCALNDARSCEWMGWFYAYYPKMPAKDVERAIPYYVRACAAYSGQACYTLAVLKPNEALNWLAEGCKRAFGAACAGYGAFMLANIAESEWANPRIQEQLFLSLARGCLYQSVAGFRLLGNVLREGLGAGLKDPKLARYLLQTACAADDANGCYFLAEGHHHGNIEKANQKLALALYQKACRLGSKLACKSSK